MITNKTVLETAAKQLLAGVFGFSGNRCAYRVGEIASSLPKCFIGALIPDEQYRQVFDVENYSAIDVLDELVRRGAEERHEVDEDFANEVQMVHDNIFLDVHAVRELRPDAGSPKHKARAAGDLINLADNNKIDLDPDLRTKLATLHATFPV
jgi:hypothetical protein